MGQPIVVVDAFTDKPFAGNPAAVCVLPHATTEEWMLAVAAELNLSETAFIVARDDGAFDLRWFTPTTEVALCGHATLASTHVLGGTPTFHTLSSALTCSKREDGTVEINLPATQTKPIDDPPDWASALGLTPDCVLEVRQGDIWRVVVLRSADDVRAAAPDQQAILAESAEVVVVAQGESGVDSVCRVFAPGLGIPEDPVTGAAHTVIAPWLAERTGRAEFVGEQASARGGRVGMRLDGDRVTLTGHAVTVLEGELASDPPSAS